jgi:hypothetical protein
MPNLADYGCMVLMKLIKMKNTSLNYTFTMDTFAKLMSWIAFVHVTPVKILQSSIVDST